MNIRTKGRLRHQQPDPDYIGKPMSPRLLLDPPRPETARDFDAGDGFDVAKVQWRFHRWIPLFAKLLRSPRQSRSLLLSVISGAKRLFQGDGLLFQCLFFCAADKNSPEYGGTLDLVKDGETDVADPVRPYEVGDCLM